MLLGKYIVVELKLILASVRFTTSFSITTFFSPVDSDCNPIPNERKSILESVHVSKNAPYLCRWVQKMQFSGKDADHYLGCCWLMMHSGFILKSSCNQLKYWNFQYLSNSPCLATEYMIYSRIRNQIKTKLLAKK